MRLSARVWCGRWDLWRAKRGDAGRQDRGDAQARG